MRQQVHSPDHPRRSSLAPGMAGDVGVINQHTQEYQTANYQNEHKPFADTEAGSKRTAGLRFTLRKSLRGD